jgi:hypothetical protein
MINYRIVNPTVSFLNDGSIIGDLPRMELDTLWEGGSHPDTSTIEEITSNLGRVQLRHFLSGEVFWEGRDYPTYQEVQVANTQAQPAAEVTRRMSHPTSNLEDVTRQPELKVQKRRRIKLLGWKTLDKVNISFDTQEEN